MVFALIEKGKVVNCIEADEKFIATLEGVWINADIVFKDAYVKKVAINDDYDEATGLCTRPKPYDSWVIDNKLEWVAPIEKPTDETETKKYQWNESEKGWQEISIYKPTTGKDAGKIFVIETSTIRKDTKQMEDIKLGDIKLDIAK